MTSRIRRYLFVCASVTWMVTGTPTARAASLQEVPDYGASGVPDYVDMFIYVPDTLAHNPPIVVASHFCGGNAQLFFSIFEGSLIASADEHGFIAIFPQATDKNCWDVGSTESLTHGGGGETEAIVQMVRYALDTYDGDPSRVYALGISSGAMMTQALLGVYPEVFQAGAAISGVPCGCWADSYDPGARWSSSCADGNVDKPAQAWGDTVRAMYPGYTGHRPRVQLWHGASDDIIDYANFGEAIEEWTDVLSLDSAPNATDQPAPDFTRQRWQNDCGYTVLEAWSQANGTHDVPIMGDAILEFFGLGVAGPDPEATACGVDAGPSDAGSDDAGVPEGELDAGVPPAAGTGGVGGAGGSGSGGGQAMMPMSGGAGGSAGMAPEPQGGERADAGSDDDAESSSSGCAVTTRVAQAPRVGGVLLCSALVALRFRRRPKRIRVAAERAMRDHS